MKIAGARVYSNDPNRQPRGIVAAEPSYGAHGWRLLVVDEGGHFVDYPAASVTIDPAVREDPSPVTRVSSNTSKEK